MAEPFTIKNFVPDGDPEGVRIIDHMNWTGLGIVFPRQKWPDTKKRDEFDYAGIYILSGFEEDDDLPTLYIGQADGLRNRIESHFKNKEFWDWGAVFVSTNQGLNRAHITWLEYMLIKQAQEANRSRLENMATPQEPNLTEAEKADTKRFLQEVLQILPLVGLRAFEKPAVIADPDSDESIPVPTVGLQTDKDTIIVPAQREGFERVFLGEDCWYAIRITGGMLPKIKWIAAYQTQPISAVTHLAEVDHIEPYGESGKYKVVFKGAAEKLESQLPYGDTPLGAMQGQRYTTLAKLKTAKSVADLIT